MGYDYSEWGKYKLSDNEHSFYYPKTWKSGTTENGLLYFYENDELENKIIRFITIFYGMENGQKE